MKPVIDDFLNLKWPVDAKISPDGKKVAYTLRTTNWKDNRYENLCFIFNIDTKVTTQLTKSGSVTMMRWQNNNDLALLKNNFGTEKPQLWFYPELIGDGIQLTEHPSGVETFEFYCDGIIYLADDAERKDKKTRKEKYGNFTHFEQDESASTLYYTSVKDMIEYKENQKIGEKPIAPIIELSKLLPNHPKITGIYPSTIKEIIYLNCRAKDYLIYSKETSNFYIKFKPDKILKEFLNKGGGDKAYEDSSFLGEAIEIPLPKVSHIAAVSPDGSKLIINHKEEEKSYIQSDLWLLDISKENARKYFKKINLIKLSVNLDQSISNIKWVNDGIYVSYSESTKTRISKLSEKGELETIPLDEFFPIAGFDASNEGSLLFIGANSKSYPELILKKLESSQTMVTALTNFGNQISTWDLGKVKKINWLSKDGTIIEGVIRKPVNFDPTKKYALAFIVHGGPQAVSHETLLEVRDFTHYPSPIFAEKEIITVKPNYRGSTGRGKNFLALNKENLGVGDLWDIESCIDYLVAEGFADNKRVGCMGWSQGGYISAMASTSSHRFKAV
ncbi:S9 family peptidase, partial [Candidatus Bathyarchaeota archaeon]|nr:S9 family peptidase [Candidatus Bathyarchaeota archaeon]